MTRKDIDNIISIICPNDEDFEKPIISPAYLKNELEALALEQEPCTDAISREDALQALCKAVHKNDDTIPCLNQRVSCLWDKTKVQDYAEEILKLPPVKPQYTDAEIQKMQDLEFAEIQKAYEIGKDEGSSEKPNKWIPVSERLPEAWRYVNCTCHSLVDDREDWVIETAYVPQPKGSPYSDWGNIVMLNDGDCEVIAWMYRDIPEPYKASPTGAERSE